MGWCVCVVCVREREIEREVSGVIGGKEQRVRVIGGTEQRVIRGKEQRVNGL